jgi:hypothetical protein
MTLPGPMRASDSKMMLSLIFAIVALCHPDRPGVPEAFIL